MLNKKGIVFVAIGAVLILSALSLYLYNQNEDMQAGQEAESLLLDIQSLIEGGSLYESSTVIEPSSTLQPDQPVKARNREKSEHKRAQQAIDPTLPEVSVQGYGCIGYISIPILELELPIMSEWDYDRLRIAPCRQFGSSKTDDLVIAAHNYDRHFGRLKNLAEGDSVIFTDMHGNVNRYEVMMVEMLAPDAVEVVQSSDSSLVLYTCTLGGASRVAVFCNRINNRLEKTAAAYISADRVNRTVESD